MGVWSFYFLAKLYLYFRGFIRFDFVLNFLFVIFLIVPVPSRLRFYKSLTMGKYVLSVALGLLLLWHDSWLPPLWDSLTFLGREGIPEKEYVYRFILGFFSLREVAVLAAILTVCILIRNRIRLTPVVMLLLLIVPLHEFGQPGGGMASRLDAFYRSESARVIRFNEARTTDPDFDIVLLHVCSLSWDDLKEIGREADVFFAQFDFLLTDFNTVTAHSNPSAIRLLRANCGQPPHGALYQDAQKGCYLFDSLRAAGYETYFTLNHDGLYSDFSKEVQALGHLDTPRMPTGLPLQARNFDGSPIYDDYAVLEKWWTIRQGSPSGQAAVYYNTISLHDGAHWAGDKNWWKRDRQEKYKEFVLKLFGDLTKFIDLVSSSGRNVVIVFVPEHGMALRGNPLQAPGLREIPLPPITRVPVGVKLIGPGYPRMPEPQRRISVPTSYLALSYFLATFLERDPFGKERAGFLDELPDHVPQTEFVAENQSARVVKKGPDYFLYDKGNRWIILPVTAVQ